MKLNGENKIENKKEGIKPSIKRDQRQGEQLATKQTLDHAGNYCGITRHRQIVTLGNY